jgi:hypothetical protein
MVQFTQQPTLNRVPQATNSTRPSPRWHVTASTRDRTLVLEILHDAVEYVETRYVYEEGQAYEVVDRAEYDRRREMFEMHREPALTDEEHEKELGEYLSQFWPTELGGSLDAYFTDLSNRYKAIQYALRTEWTI